MMFTAEDYQHIEFGVDEVMDSTPVGVKDPLFKVSSTLNPQAPEFILGCQSAHNTQQFAALSANIMDGVHFDSVDCPDSEVSAVDDQACQDMDGISGDLGPRERRKKKKRPPGYYNYLEGSAGNSSSGGTMAGGVPMPVLLNGHTLGAPNHCVDIVVGKALAEAELSSPSPVSIVTPIAVVMQADLASVATGNQRTCISPGLSSLDLTSRAASLLDGNNATSSSASSQSSGVTEEPQVADQQPDNLTLRSPECLDSGSQSPCPKSPIPPTDCVACHVVSLDTAATEPEEDEDFGVANGLAESDTAVSTDGHTEDRCETAGPVQPDSPDTVAQPVSEQVHASSIPSANPPKSWASLFHNSKPLPGGPQAFVEVKNVVEVVTPTPVVPKQPEKAGEVKESPVHVSEDPMAPQLAGITFTCALCSKGGLLWSVWFHSISNAFLAAARHNVLFFSYTRWQY